jgi:hypothetical protein
MSTEKEKIPQFEYELDIQQILTDWKGKPLDIVDEDQSTAEKCKTCQQPVRVEFRDMLLDDALLDYCNRAEAWGMSVKEQFKIYDLGERIANADGGMVMLSLAEWDLLKKLVAAAKERYATRIKIQVERLVGAAKQVPTAKAGEPAPPAAGEEGGGGND